MTTPSPYAARPWLRHYDHCARPHLSYPGRPLGGSSATADEVIAHCRTGLSEYEVPRLVDIRDTLPMSAAGNILYRVLRDEHAAVAAARS